MAIIEVIPPDRISFTRVVKCIMIDMLIIKMQQPQGCLNTRRRIMSTLQDLLQRAEAAKQITSTSSSHHVQDAANEYMMKLAGQKDLDITEDMIRELHRLLCCKQDKDGAGQYRRSRVSQSGRDNAPPQPEDVPHLMKHFAAQIHFSRSTLHPIELAAMTHKRLVDIHPFEKGNRETAMLLMNLILAHNGYSTVSLCPEMEDDYENALSSSRRFNDMNPFSQLIAQWVVKAQD